MLLVLLVYPPVYMFPPLRFRFMEVFISKLLDRSHKFVTHLGYLKANRSLIYEHNQNVLH